MLKYLVIANKYFVELFYRFVFQSQMHMRSTGKNQLTPDALLGNLDKQKAILDTPIGLSDRERNDLQEIFEGEAALKSIAYRNGGAGTLFDLQDFFQQVLDGFELIAGRKYEFRDQQMEAIMLRLNKMLYHTYKMNFSEDGPEDSNLVAFGKKLRPKQEPFDLEKIVEFAAEAFRRDLASTL